MITNPATGMILSMESGGELKVQPKDDSDRKQRWIIQPTNNKKLFNFVNAESGEYATIENNHWKGNVSSVVGKVNRKQEIIIEVELGRCCENEETPEVEVPDGSRGQST